MEGRGERQRERDGGEGRRDRDREREGGEGREGRRWKKGERETICNFTDTVMEIHVHI